MLSVVKWRFSFTSFWFVITLLILLLICILFLCFSGNTNSLEFRFQKVKSIRYRFSLGWVVSQEQFSALSWLGHTHTTSITTAIAWTMQVMTSFITPVVMLGSLLITDVIRNATARLSILSYGPLFWNSCSRMTFRAEYCFGSTTVHNRRPQAILAGCRSLSRCAVL